MSRWWKWYLPGYVTLLPWTVVYVVFCLIWYRATTWTFRSGILTCVSDRLGKTFQGTGAQTVGAAMCFDDQVQLARAELHCHERTHVVEQMLCGTAGLIVGAIIGAVGPWDLLWTTLIGGWIGASAYAVLYVGIFLRWYLTDQGTSERLGWHDDYHRNWLETTAYDAEEHFLQTPRAERGKFWS